MVRHWGSCGLLRRTHAPLQDQRIERLKLGPLGKYSQSVAALVAVGVIAAAVALRLLGMTPDPFIDNIALIAMGAIFGAAASASASGQKIDQAIQANGHHAPTMVKVETAHILAPVEEGVEP